MTDDFDPAGPIAEDAGLYGLPSTEENSRVHIIAVPFEVTVSYGSGTSNAPDSVRLASHQLDLFDLDTGRPYEAGIFMFDQPEIAALNREVGEAAGFLRDQWYDDDEADKARVRVNAAGAGVNSLVQDAARKSLDAGKLVGVLGGDHASPFGLIAELATRHSNFGILHIDAHHDLRDAYEGFTWSHASIMHNVMTKIEGVERLVQVGIRDFSEGEKRMVDESNRRIIAHYDQDLARAKFAGQPFDDVISAIVEELPSRVYVSFDIDGLDPKLCPHTGTPVPGGLDFNEAMHLLNRVKQSGRTIVGFDLCEVGSQTFDANVGARVLYRLIAYALATQE